MTTSCKRVCVSSVAVEGRQHGFNGGNLKPFLIGMCDDRVTALLSGAPSDYFTMASVNIPDEVSSAVLKPSDPIPQDAVSVQGPNFDSPLDLQQFISSYERIGFQANSLGRAIQIINRMVWIVSVRNPYLDDLSCLIDQMASFR